MAKITNEMATNISLDVTNAKKSLKDLTQEVKNSNNEWKIQENQLKAAGDSANASKARYEGLSSTVDKQREKVTALKGALENTNTSTEKGQKLQSYLTQELAKAERQLNSYQGQLDKATQSYKYQSSGLAKLNDDIKHSNDLTDARVRKLEAEGKTEEAQKARLEQLHSVRVNYNKILDVQKSELNKLAEAGDKNSSSYKKQELRVAEMSAKIAETTSKIKDLNHQGIHIDTGKLANLREQLNKTNELLNKTNHHFRTIFLGNVAASAFTNTLTSVQTHLSDMVRSANDYNKEQQVMNATWTTLTDSADKGKDMVKSINNMSTAFGQSSDVVNELDQQFYHVFNQKEPTEQLTKSMLTMADTLGMNNEEVQRLGLNFTHMMTSSKMQLGDFNMITDQLPMYGEKLLEYEKEVQHNSQLTMAELRKQMSDGKISAEDATKVMNELGDKYKDASENMMGTFTGMQRRIKSQSKMLIGSLTEPILNTKNPLFESVSKWVADERTVKEFDKLGKQISKSFNVVSQAFSSQFKSKDFTDFANSAMETATKKIEQFGNYIANHAKDIQNFFKMVAELSKTGFGVMGTTLKIALPLLESLGSFASKNPTTFKILAGSILGVNLAIKGTLSAFRGFETARAAIGVIRSFKTALTGMSIIQKTTTAVKGFGLALKGLVIGNPIGLIVTALVALGVGLYELYKHNAKFKKFVDGIFKSLADAGKKIGKSVGDIGKKISKAFNPIGKDINKELKGSFKGVGQIFSGVGKEFNKAWGNVKKEFSVDTKEIQHGLSEFGKFFGNIFSGVNKFLKEHQKEFKQFGKVIADVFKTTITVALIPLGIAFGVAFTGIRVAISMLIAAIVPVAKIFADVFKTVIGVLSGAAKVITSTMKLIYHIFTGNWKAIGKDIKVILAGYSKIFSSFIKGSISIFNDFWNGIWKILSAGVKTLGKMLAPIGKVWNKCWDGVTDYFKSIWNGIVKFFEPIIKWLSDIITTTIRNIQKTWENIWNSISSFFSGIWKWITKTGSDAINGIHDTISSVLDSIGKVWNNMWRSFSDFFGSIWGDIKSFAKKGMDGVISIINQGVDAIDNVWKFFTGHETSIHHLEPVHFERGGIVKTRMSMINDGKGENWKELIQLPDGQLKMSNKRDHVLPLPVGTRIYNGEQTKQIMNAAGVTKYASGGIVGDVIDWGKGAFNDVSSWIGDKFEAVTSFLKDPLKNVVNMITKATDSMYSGLHNFGDMAHGVWDNLYNPIADWFKKGLEEVKKSMSRSAPGGAGVERWRSQVVDALKENGMSTESWAVDKIMRQIATESNGDETVTQGGYTDINTITGDLAKGLMQTISSTFNAYAFPGHGNIFNGYDNLLAAINYIKHTYGPDMPSIGEGHGYANGGLVSNHQIAQIAEGNKPEMIIPLDSMKSARGFELLGKTAVAMAARDGQQPTTVDNAETNKKLDTLIMLMAQMVGINQDQLNSMLSSGNHDNRALYQQMAQDTAMRKYQSI
ncbi:tape measure protein [Convivina praedatoris]|uniref:tape measure protein n=1 Tax=Convivina praedatoris TaxID=2880963 RepID=UPI00200C003B|nr:tape measure protein [Convivina sp. LMG 32447]CAH1855128.1 hypothetical protein R078138_01065 [Convivina sp. LMG 32447]